MRDGARAIDCIHQNQYPRGGERARALGLYREPQVLAVLAWKFWSGILQ